MWTSEVLSLSVGIGIAIGFVGLIAWRGATRVEAATRRRMMPIVWLVWHAIRVVTLGCAPMRILSSFVEHSGLLQQCADSPTELAVICAIPSLVGGVIGLALIAMTRCISVLSLEMRDVTAALR
ncbi:hypothetical protein SAMN05444157_0730 [Frankineae bacterium MT45]|nr:hypothetical protein SAMN05444157_0730 [Frankineae bacterium MT45]